MGFPLTGGLRASPRGWENPHNDLQMGKLKNKKKIKAEYLVDEIHRKLHYVPYE